MRILVMGAGALGSVAGGFMARAGHEVHLVGREAHVTRIVERGLFIPMFLSPLMEFATAKKDLNEKKKKQ